MNTSKKLILATFVISTLSLGGLAASASIKNPQTHPIISPQSAKSTSIAEASDGDGEMNARSRTRKQNCTRKLL